MNDDKPTNVVSRHLDNLGRNTVRGIEEVGNGGVMMFESLYWLIFGQKQGQPVRLNSVVEQMMGIGITAIPIIAMLAGAISVTLAIQSIFILRIFGAESYVTAGLA